MKSKNIILLLLLLYSFSTFGQEGKILEKERIILNDSTINRITEIDPKLADSLRHIEFYRITYLSDSLRVKGFVAKPNRSGKFPCIISNRGGNREYGKWTELSIAFFLGRMASWNYVVIASQYRGNDGGEGQDEFGGEDLNDVLNLTKTLKQIEGADTTRIGMEGASRGGMMTYKAMKETCEFKAAVVLAGSANAFEHLVHRPDFEENVYAQVIPDYTDNKKQALTDRSAVFWADEMCKTTPLLIMQGSSDWRVPASESLELLEKLYESNHPVRYILFEGADHGIREYRKEVFSQTKKFFDYYLRDLNELPNMEKHRR